MKHPKPEDWIPYVCGEASPEARALLDEHLGACAECEARLAQWRGAFSALDKWQIPAPPQARPARRQWAAGLAAMLALGFVLGFATTQARSASRLAAAEERLKADLGAALASQARREMAAMIGEEVAGQLSSAAPGLAYAARRESEQSLAMFARHIQQAREEDRALESARLAALERRLADQYLAVVALRKDLETLAATASDEIGMAKADLRQLIAVTATDFANHQ